MNKRTVSLLISIVVVISAGLIVFNSNADKNAYRVCLFSAISGTVTLDGKPLSNIRITRSANYWNKDNHTDETVTDAKGRFEFKPMYVNSKHISQSMNPIIFEKLIIHHLGKEYVGWDTMRGDIQPNIELGRNIPIPALHCDLSNPSTTKDVKYGTVNGICKW